MINIHCALWCEAAPIVSLFRLKHVASHPFKLYQGQDVRVVVSGIGKVNTAAALGFLFANGECERDLGWLNIGVCGSGSRAIGETLLINKITDMESLQTWFPPQLLTDSIARSELQTLSRPSRDYPPEGVVDMEASVFADVASRFASGELVQVVKIVSDNNDFAMHDVDEKHVKALVESNLDTIRLVVRRLGELRQVVAEDDRVSTAFRAFTGNTHFTAYQRAQLRRLLERIVALGPEVELPTLMQAKDCKARDVIGMLNDLLTKSAVRF